jgi:hypothetical protein
MPHIAKYFFHWLGNQRFPSQMPAKSILCNISYVQDLTTTNLQPVLLPIPMIGLKVGE